MGNKPLIEYFINIEFIPSIIIISIGSSRLYEGHVLYMASFFYYVPFIGPLVKWKVQHGCLI